MPFFCFRLNFLSFSQHLLYNGIIFGIFQYLNTNEAKGILEDG